jgi:hypothetical protein
MAAILLSKIVPLVNSEHIALTKTSIRIRGERGDNITVTWVSVAIAGTVSAVQLSQFPGRHLDAAFQNSH